MGNIVAVVTLDRQKVGGGAPIFIAETTDEFQKLSFRLEKILNATAHDMQNGTMILVKHGS